MKKLSVIVPVAIGVLLVLWFAAKKAHVLEVYTIPTTASMPTYKPGSWVMASRLKKTDNNSFITFLHSDNTVWIFRCIAKGGDVIEMRNALVYLNGKLLDEPFAWNEYYISKKQLMNIAGYLETNKNPVRAINDSLFSVTLTTGELKQYGLALKPCTAPKDSVNANMFAAFKSAGYNEDNFGPVTVPKDNVFVLGDSRHDAYDSRYFGFIRSDNVLSTIIR